MNATMSEDWYNVEDTKKQLTCILNGCKICNALVYCRSHDKPANGTAPGIPSHCDQCGEFIYDEQRDTKGMFGA